MQRRGFVRLFVTLLALGCGCRAFADAQILMQAFDARNQPLEDGVPLYYMVAHSKQTVPVFQKHRGAELRPFDETKGADYQSYIGIYLPAGYSAKYRLHFAQTSNGVCNRSPLSSTDPWIHYDTARPSAQNLHMLQLGQAALSQLPAKHCLYIQWQIAKDESYPGKILDLFERPFAAANGIENMPATQELVGQGSGRDAAWISYEVAGYEGNVGRSLKIRTGDRQPISILHNIGAPTDDGMVWGIAAQGATGLYEPGTGSPDKIDFGASQFCGHSSVGSVLGGTQWGMQVPVVRRGQTLTMDDHRCAESPCYVPMYTDFTSATSESRMGTTPFAFPRSAHPFDARIDEISVMNVLHSDGSPGPVEKLTVAFKYRAHLPFQADKINPHLWLNLALTDVQSGTRSRFEPKLPVETYVVRDDGTIGYLSWNDLENADAPERAEAAWKVFCGDHRKTHCGDNSRQQNRFVCSCSYIANKSTIKRLIVNYLGKNVAMAIAPFERPTFSKFIYTRTFHPPGRPGALVSASSTYFLPRGMNNAALQYSPADSAVADGYLLYVGTLQDLTDACVGIKDCKSRVRR
jgi:hypothetical protein